MEQLAILTIAGTGMIAVLGGIGTATVSTLVGTEGHERADPSPVFSESADPDIAPALALHNPPASGGVFETGDGSPDFGRGGLGGDAPNADRARDSITLGSHTTLDGDGDSETCRAFDVACHVSNAWNDLGQSLGWFQQYLRQRHRIVDELVAAVMHFVNDCLGTGFDEATCSAPQDQAHHHGYVGKSVTSRATSPTTGPIPDWWMDEVRACYERNDLGCVRNWFAVLAAGSLVRGYPLAGRAMVNFLVSGGPLHLGADDVLQKGSKNLYQAWGGKYVSFDEARAAAFEAATALASPELGVEYPVGHYRVGPGSNDVRYAVGRVGLSAFVTFEPGPAGRVMTLRFHAEETYDWHPDFFGTGEPSPEYHRWAGALVDAGLAGEFPVIIDWTERHIVP